jgi:hypothetical protein
MYVFDLAWRRIGTMLSISLTQLEEIDTHIYPSKPTYLPNDSSELSLSINNARKHPY